MKTLMQKLEELEALAGVFSERDRVRYEEICSEIDRINQMILEEMCQ